MTETRLLSCLAPFQGGEYAGTVKVSRHTLTVSLPRARREQFLEKFQSKKRGIRSVPVCNEKYPSIRL